jgi:indolepyruvate ferredoxin oxidoreductase alpha subunit
MQERSHAFAMESQLWPLDPRPNLSSIVWLVEHGFALPEASSTPVMLEVRIRACHVQGSLTPRNRPPPFSLTRRAVHRRRDTGRIVLPPASFGHERDRIAPVTHGVGLHPGA